VSAPQHYNRFSRWQRLEHALLILSFTVLAVTGLPQKYMQFDLSRGLIALMGGIESTRQIHHIAAIMLMLESVYHFVAVGYRIFVRRAQLSMLPGLRDLNDAINEFLFNIGVKKERVQGGRYTYAEKAEYWALLWGTVIMIITGFMMWNPIATASLFPGQFIPAAKAAHGAEAVLAVLAILLWHFYHVHIRNFNRSMFTGKVSEHEMIEEHPLELADLKASAPPVDDVQLKKRRQVYYPLAAVASAVLLFGLLAFVSFEQTAITTVERGEVQEAFNPLTPTPIPTLRPTATPYPLDAVWERNVGLLMQIRCGECHDGTTAGLDLNTFNTIMLGNANGPVVVPGDPDGSLLVQKMLRPHPGRLNDFELGVVRDWIAAGAPRR
jgi:cytochrome b subunit of formate dehydrogenase